YWRLGLYIMISNYIKGCTSYQQMKTNIHLIQLILLNTLLGSFDFITYDFIIDLPISNRFNALLVIVNYDYIKEVILSSCMKTVDVISTAQLLHDRVYRRFGL
ncbi:hypothetical protein C8Q75DRAFT_724645, partial [Abortiporus biennis]